MLSDWVELLGQVAAGPEEAGPGEAGPDDAVADAGRDLLARYAEPQRRYHDQRHLAEVLTAVDRLAAHADRPDAVRLAAWFHDAVYDPQAAAGRNEAASADLAVATLGRLGVPVGLVAQVAELVRMTADHDPVGADALVLSDADLAVLGSAPSRYAEYARDVRREYAHVPEAAFRAGRSAILRGFLARPRIYTTATGSAAWEQAARTNLAAELLDLSV